MSNLNKNPNRLRKLVKQANNFGGAFNYDPKNLQQKLVGKREKIAGKLQGDISKKKQRKLNRKLEKVEGALGNMQQSMPYQMQGVNNQANQGINQQMGYIQDQGQFAAQGLPNLNQDYSDWRQKAEANVMDSFNRNMQPEFDRQLEQFQQQMYNQGVGADTEKYKNQYQQLMDAQNNARQNAMSQAFSAGQGEQAQAFNQAYNTNQLGFNQQYQTYQTPYQNLGAFNPYYAGQMNQMNQYGQNQFNQGLQNQQYDWQANQNQLDRDAQMRIASMRGGGGAAPDPNAGLNQFYDQYLQQFNQQPQQPSAGNAAVQGFAGGVGAGVANSIFA